jgi:NAD-dependent SIR2 family protein deacetylase
MADPIQTLANILDLKKADRKCVLMLGAGASLSSGVKPTATIMEELVAKYYGDGPDPVRDRFD